MIAATAEYLATLYHAHPLIWTAAAVFVGYLIGEAWTLSKWNAERRRLRKRLGVATLEDYAHSD